MRPPRLQPSHALIASRPEHVPRHIATTIHAAVSTAPCGNSGPLHPGLETLAAHSGRGGQTPKISLHLGGAICPGTQFTFTDYRSAENFRLELDIPSISLDRHLML
jgi:hypothetical protein